MKKILSIILITACLACGCSSASGTGKNTSKSTASEPESIDFFAMDTTIKFSAYGDKKVLKGAKKVLTDLEKKVSVTDSGSEIYHINQNGSGTLTETTKIIFRLFHILSGLIHLGVFKHRRKESTAKHIHQAPIFCTVQVFFCCSKTT